MQNALESFRPDAVIHTAYVLSGPDLWPVTAEGSKHVAQASQDLGVRLIHMSTDIVFDGTRGAYKETDPTSPITEYGQAKLQAEEFVAEHPNAVIVRSSLIYGFEPPDRGTRFVLDLAEGKAKGQLFTDEYRSPVLVGDLARALLELSESSHTGILHVAGPDSLSRYQLGVLLAKAYGRDPKQLPTGLASQFPTPRPLNCTLDISPAQSLLKTRLRSVQEVLSALDTRP